MTSWAMCFLSTPGRKSPFNTLEVKADHQAAVEHIPSRLHSKTTRPVFRYLLMELTMAESSSPFVTSMMILPW